MDAKNHIVDKSRVLIPEGTMEDFKRPDHPDFMVAKELAERSFTGFRHNSLTNAVEIWMLGEVKESISAEQVAMDPLAINKAVEEVFAMHRVMPDTDEVLDYDGVTRDK